MVAEQLTAALDRLPKVSGAQIYASQRLSALLDAAWKIAQGLKDEYLSTEHLLLAIADEKKGDAGRILRETGLTRENILTLLQTIRGSQRVTDQEPEGKYEALEPRTILFSSANRAWARRRLRKVLPGVSSRATCPRG